MKIILYHKIAIKQIKYKNKVRFFLHFFEFAGIIAYVLYVVKFFMKKVFIQIRQWVLKHRKKIIYGAIALFVFQIWFFDSCWIWMDNNVFAEDGQASTENDFTSKLASWDNDLSFFKVVLYVFVYPILIIAWKLVDNSMVYWEIFWFDAILRRLWVIIRNIANFCLWGLVLYNIFNFLITGQKTDDIKKLLISTLIAWVGIQASWFIMAVLIDASTVVTYGIGSLPTTVLDDGDIKDPKSLLDDENKLQSKNPYVLKTTLFYDAENPEHIEIYMSTLKNQYISECEVFEISKGTEKESIILAPKYIYYKWWSGVLTEQLMCNYENNIYSFNNLVVDRKTCSWTWCKTEQENYDAAIEDKEGELKTNIDSVREHIQRWEILQIWNAHASWWINGRIFQWIQYDTSQERGLDINNERIWTWWNAKKMSEIIDWTYAWVFTNLYTSLLNMGKDAKLTKGPVQATAPKLLNECISVLFLLIITVPLLAMTIVFVIRIFVLWVAIAISPIIVLMQAFNLRGKVKEKVWSGGMSNYLEYFEISNLIWIIFFPAIMCFAVSLSSVLVETIKYLNYEEIGTSPISILSWVVTLDIAGFWVATWKIICSIISLAVTRFLLRACIQFTKIWKSETWIVNSLRKLAEKAAWSLPIIPVPTPNWVRTVGRDAAFKSNGGYFNNVVQQLKTTFEEEDISAFNNFFNKKPPASNPSNQAPWNNGGSLPATSIQWYVQALTSNIPQNRIDQDINVGGSTLKFSGLHPQDQKNIINEINNLSDPSIKDSLWTSSPRITIDNDTYTYNQAQGKYTI